MIALLLFLSLVLAGSIIGQAISIVHIVNLVFIDDAAFDRTLPYALLLAISISMRLLATSLLSFTGGQLAERVKNEVRAQLLEKWTKTSAELHQQQQTGSKVTLFVESVDALESYYRDYVPQVIKSLVIPLAVLIAVFTVHANSGWILLITAPFIPLTYIIIGLQTQAKSEEQLEAMNRFSGKFLDLLQGLQTLRLFGQSTKQREALALSNNGFMHTTLTVLKIAFASTLFIELITTLGIGLVALEIGFQMIVFKTLAFAPAFLVLTLAPEYYNSLKDLGAAFHTGRGSLGAATLLHDALKQDVPVISWGQQPIGRKPSISMQQAVFHYTDGPQIGPLTLDIARGETVAIIGPTGHGKTTTLHMLAGFVALQAGTLTIDGKPRHTVDEQAWYNEMAFMSQHPYLFAGSLRDNICMGKTATDTEIFAALAQAQLTDWVAQLTDGLETKIGEAGRGLSGGEQQRVAIARAFLKQPSIVFFDEPTAGLDVHTEHLIARSIKVLSEQATTVIVAHRFQTIAHATKLFILEHGQLVAAGTHAQLATHPVYRAMKDGGERHGGTI